MSVIEGRLAQMRRWLRIYRKRILRNKRARIRLRYGTAGIWARLRVDMYAQTEQHKAPDLFTVTMSPRAWRHKRNSAEEIFAHELCHVAHWIATSAVHRDNDAELLEETVDQLACLHVKMVKAKL